MAYKMVTTFSGQYVPKEHEDKWGRIEFNDLMHPQAKEGQKMGQFTVTVEWQFDGPGADPAIGPETGDFFEVKEGMEVYPLLDPRTHRHVKGEKRFDKTGEILKQGDACILMSVETMYLQNRRDQYLGTLSQEAVPVLLLMSPRGRVGWYPQASFKWLKKKLSAVT